MTCNVSRKNSALCFFSLQWLNEISPTVPDSSFSSVSSLSLSLSHPAAHNPALTSSSALPACQVSSFLAHLSPTPVWAVSSRKGGQDAVASSLSRVLSRWVDTSQSLSCLPPPLESQSYPRDSASGGVFCCTLSEFRKLGTFLSLLHCTYTDIQTQLRGHSCRHRNTLFYEQTCSQVWAA